LEPDSDSCEALSGFLPVLVEIKRRLENVYGEGVVDVIPCGVGLLENFSGVDAAVVLRKEEEHGGDLGKICRALESLVKGRKINVRFLSQEKLEHAKWPLYVQRKWRKKR